VYGLTAVGLVLTYKTSGLFNFAHGAMATVSAYAFCSLTVTSAGLTTLYAEVAQREGRVDLLASWACPHRGLVEDLIFNLE
jgi:branched-subunit amino acid ABC-type transport system permease component